MAASPRRALAALCLTVFTDLVGFGVILPVLPYAAEESGASGAGVGAVFAAYSIAQLLAAPVLGAASDRYGRKRLLLIALTGSVLSLTWMAVAHSLPALLAARTLAGACGGSIGVAHAFAADLAPPGRRTRVLGAVGAAVGLGFTAGPALGALLAGTGMTGASLAAAGIALAALILAAVVLPDVRPAAARTGSGRRPRATGRQAAGYRGLLAAVLATTAAFTAMEATIALLGADRHGLTAHGLGWLLAAAGLALAAVEGGLVGPLTRVLDTAALAAAGAATMAVALALLPLLPTAGTVVALLVLAAGYGMVTPALSTLVTERAPGRTGAAMGASQSAAALARAFAPLAAGAAYDLGPVWPYAAAAALSAAAALAVRRHAAP